MDRAQATGACENVQRRFTKRISTVSHLSYSDRLRVLGIESLEYRRLKFDLIMFYKIVHNLIDVDRDALITLRVNDTVTRNSYLKIFKPLCMSRVRCNFLCIRCVWNSLSETVRAASSIASFKYGLRQCNLSPFLTVYT